MAMSHFGTKEYSKPPEMPYVGGYAPIGCGPQRLWRQPFRESLQFRKPMEYVIERQLFRLQNRSATIVCNDFSEPENHRFVGRDLNKNE